MTVDISDEEGAGKAFVVAEAFDDFLLGIETLTGLDSDDAVFADFADDFGNERANFGVASGNGGDFSDFFVVAIDFFGESIDFGDNFGAGLLDAFAEFHRIDAGGDEFVSFGEDIISQNSDSGGAITSDLIELGGSGFDELSADLFAEIVVGAAEINGFGDGNAVVGDGGGAIRLFDDNILTFGAESNLDGIIKLFGTSENLVAGFIIVKDFFHKIPAFLRLNNYKVARMSSSLTMM